MITSVNKHLMTGPRKTESFVLPKTLDIDVPRGKAEGSIS